MARRVREDDHRSDELLEEHGRIASGLGLAIAWTSGIRGEMAKVAKDKGSGAWKGAAPLQEGAFAAALFKEKCRTRNPICAAAASELVLIEVDGDDRLPDRLGLHLPSTVTARSRRGLHLYYRPAAGCTPAKFQIAEEGVTRSEDGYLVMPPSLHPSGHVYEWLTNDRIATLPEADFSALDVASGKTGRCIAERFVAGGPIPRGHRHLFIFHRALDLAHAGLSESEILPSMLVLGRERCEPPLSDDAVRNQVRGAVKRAHAKPSAQRQLVLEAERELAARITHEAESPVTEVRNVDPSSPGTRPGVIGTKRPLTIITTDTIAARRQRWLAHGLVPLRTLTLVAGVGGLGKSTWAVQLIGRLTRGELECEGDAVIVSFEDAAEEIIRPRLQATEAVLSRVGILVKEGGLLSLPRDFGELKHLLREREVRLLVIDPVSAAIDLKLDAHRDQDVRVVLGELGRIVESLDMAAILVGHLNKAPSTEAYIRINGSTAFYNACRSVVTVTLDPDGDGEYRLIAQHKANYSRLVPVQRHRIEEHSYWEGDEFIVTSRMVFVEDADDVDPNLVLKSTEQRTPTKKETAGTLLLAMLADGEEHERDGLERLASARGISRRTLERAARALGVETSSGSRQLVESVGARLSAPPGRSASKRSSGASQPAPGGASLLHQRLPPTR